jgi:CheY-like chemotaxis protein
MPEKLRVLVVDDNIDSAESLVLLLNRWGHDSRFCTEANQALGLVPDFKPHAVLIDIDLGRGMNGWELARHLTEKELVLIAVTGRGEANDYRRSAEAGILYHLVKPDFHAQLQELLARLT